MLLLFSSVTYSQYSCFKGSLVIKPEYNCGIRTVTLYRIGTIKPIDRQILKDTFIFKFDSLKTGKYFIYIENMETSAYYKNIELTENDTLTKEINFPPIKCPYSKENKTCPHGHKNRIVNIVYGYPGWYMNLLSRLGIIHLGGCTTKDCAPKYYCKKHKLEF